MEIRCPSCKKRYVIKKPGKYKCRACGKMLPDIRPEDLPQAKKLETPGVKIDTPQRGADPGAGAARAAQTPGKEAGASMQATDQAASAPPSDTQQPAEPQLPPEMMTKVAALEEKIHENPSLKPPYLQLAQLYLDRGFVSKAIEAYNRLLEVAPDDRYVAKRVQVLINQKEAAKSSAVKPATPAMDEDGQVQASPQEAAMPELSGEHQRKADRFEELIKGDPSKKAPYLQLAQLYLDQGYKSQAVAVYKRYLAVDPTNTYIKNRIQLITGKAKAKRPVDLVPQVDKETMQRTHRKVGRVLTYAGAVLLLGIALAIVRPILFPSARLIHAADYNVYNPQWSPDGRKVAFISSKSNGPVLCIYEVKDKSIRELTSVRGGGFGKSAYAWSPTSLEIAYESYVEDEDALWGEAVFVVNVDTGQTRRIAMGEHPSWSPDGASIAMVSAGSDTVYKQWYSKRESITVCVFSALTGQISKVSKDGGINPAFSPTASQVVFEIPEEVDWEEYSKKLRESGETDSPPETDLADMLEGALEGGATTDLEARQGLAREIESIDSEAKTGKESQGGASLFISPSNIYISNSDGTGLLQLTTDNKSMSPVWTSDGRRILYRHYPEGSGKGEIWSMAADGSDKRPLVQAPFSLPSPADIALTPDGRRIIFEHTVAEMNAGAAFIMAGGSAGDLYMMDLDGNEPKRLANKHAFKGSFSLSPDGKRIAYEVNNKDTDIAEVWMMPL